MKKLTSVFVFLLSVTFINTIHADDWGKTGHRAIGEIASQYLSGSAKRKIKELLSGESLAMVSTYGDEIKSDKAFRAYGPWHYVNVPFETTYEQHPKNEAGDLIMGINNCIAKLKDEQTSRKDKVFYLKFLVHLIGDLHQPLHLGLGKDKGGNDFQVQWFWNGSNLHRVWDSGMIDSYGMTYTELATNVKGISKKERKQLQSGTVEDWAKEGRELCKDVYDNTKIGDNLNYKYMYDYMNILRFQLQKGGLRLASVLNDIF